MSHPIPSRTENSTWKGLFKVGGAAPLVALGFYLIQILAMIFGGADPTTIEDYVLLLQRNKILGLLYLNALDIFSIAFLGTMFLALCIALRHVNASYMAISAFFAFIGIAALIAPRVAMLSLLPLSDQYAAATTEAQKTMLLTAGHVMLETYTGTAFDIYYVLNTIILFIFSAIMLRSKLFSKITAYLGIAAGVLMIIPSSAGTIGLYFSLASLVPWAIWLILVGLRLLRLGAAG